MLNAQQCVQLDVDNLPNPLALPPAACSGVPVSLCLPVCSAPNVADIVVSFSIDNPNVMATETISVDANGDLCIEVLATNETCDPQTAIITINSITCASGDAVEGCVTACLVCLDAGAFFPTTLDPVDVYPDPYTVVDVAPACDGTTAGQFTLTATDGSICEDFAGTAGVLACPGTNAVLQTGPLRDYSAVGCHGPYEANYDINCDDCFCAPPTVTAMAGATNDAIDVMITNGGGNGLYDIEWGAPGFLPGTGAEIGSLYGTFNLMETIAGLGCSMTFDIYVRDNCAGPPAVSSDWVGVLAVSTTACPGQGCTDPIPLVLTCNCSVITNTLTFPFGTNTGIEDPCGMGTNNNEAIWYEFVPPVNGTLDVSATNDPATPDTDVSVLSGACGATVCEGTNDDGGAGFTSQLVGIPVLAGQSYYVEWGDDWDSAPGEWEVNFVPDSPNTTAGAAGTDTYDFTYDQAPCPTMTYEYGLPGFTQGAGIATGSSTSGTVGLTGLTPGTSYEICFYCDVLGCGDDAATVTSCDFSNADAAAGVATPILDCQSFTTNTGCPAPTNLSCIEDIATLGSMDVTWASGGGDGLYDFEYGAVGFAPGTGAEIASIYGTFNTAENVTGLVCGDTYDVYVRDNCSGPPAESSIWFGPCTVTIFCPPPPPVGVDCSGDPNADSFVVFAEEFDALGGWTVNPAPTGDGIIFPHSGGTTSTTTGPIGAASGANYVYYEATGGAAGDVNTLTSPSISLGTGIIDAELSFYVHMWSNGTANMGDLSVEVSNDGGVTWTQVNFITGEQQVNQTDPFFQVGANLAAYLGQTIQIQFVFTRGAGFESDIAIDLVEVTTCVDNGSCVLQSPGLTVNPCDDATTTSDITDDTFTFDLDPQGVGTSTYTITNTANSAVLGTGVAYGAPTNFGPYPADGSTITVTLVDDADPACSLTFDVNAPSPCSPNPAPPQGIDCSSDPNTTPFVIWFDDFEDPAIMNWTGDVDTNNDGIETGGDWVVPHPDADVATTNTGPDAAHSGSNFAFYESNTNSGQAIMTSGPINLASALIDAELSFWVHMFGLPEDMGDLEAQVSNDGGATWTTISLASGLQQSSGADPWIQAGADLSPYIGQTIQIQFVATPLATINGDIAVDLVEITTCFNNAVCILQSSGLVVGTCDDGGTPSDITDDTFTFDLDPAGAGLSTYTVTDAAGTILGAAGNAYGAPTTFGPYPSNGGVLTLTITDDADPNCFFLQDVTVPAPCSPAPPPPGMVDCSSDPTAAPFVLFSEDFEAAPGWAGDIVTVGDGWYEFDTGGTPSTGTGPLTGQSGAGYAFYEATGGAPGDVAVLTSPPISLGTALVDAELTFWVHMFDNGTGNMGSLQAQVSNDGGATWTTIVLASGQQQAAQGDPYVQTGADLSAYLGQTIQIQFVVTRGAGFESDIAIDLVEVTTCVSSSTCVMQTTELLVSDCQFNGTASDPSDDTFTFDLDPTGVGFTTYTVTDATGAVIGTAGNAYGAPTTFGPFPAGGGDLTLTVADDADPNCFLDFIVTDPGDCSPFTLQTVGTCADFDAGIPTWFVQSTTDDFDWTVGASTPSTGTGPQNGDNTTGTGQFIFIETSGGVAGDVASITSAWDLSGVTNPSLQFYYDMLGAQIGTLNVYVDDGTGNVQVFTISGNQGGGWTLVPISLAAYAGQTVLITFEAIHNGTFEGDISLDDICVVDAAVCSLLAGQEAVSDCQFNGTVSDPSDDTFDFSLDPLGTLLTGTYTVTDATGAVIGTAGNAYGVPTTFTGFSAGGGDFTITITDDTDPACTLDVVITDPGSCSPFVPQTVGTCADFDAGIPTWFVQSTTDDFDWSVGATTPSTGTGPQNGDNTTGTGQFIFIETSGGAAGDIAQITAAWDLTGVTNPSLQFFYDMLGAQIGTLNVYVDAGAGNVNVFSISGNQGGGWTGGAADLTPYAGQTVLITFEAIHNGTFEGDISLDDICVVDANVCSIIGGGVTVLPCDFNGTPTDPADDLFSVTLDPIGTLLVGTYTVTDAAGAVIGTASNPYGAPTTFGTFPAGGGDVVVTITDDTDPACTLDVTITDPGSCSDFTGLLCSDLTFVDSGGPAGDYSNSEDINYLICPDNPGDVVTVTFTTFSSENGFDEMLIFDGAGTGAPPILTPGGSPEWEWDLNDVPPGGTADPVAEGPFTSTDPSGCLTFVWNSDGSVTRPGWEADITCAPPVGCTANAGSDATVDICDANGTVDITPTDGDAGGTFTPALLSGTGVFDPITDTPGVYTYTVTDPNDPTCTDSADITVTVTNAPICNTDCTLGDLEIFDPATCSCVVDVVTVLGCTDAAACNYDPAANCDDGNCVLPDGCTDPAFCEYDPAATCDDGSCVTSNADPGTCSDGDCTNGLETWDAATCACVSNPPSGVNGCTDPAFCEYDPNADCDDGSCMTSNADPGTCGDGDCTNGVETWDATTCSCVSNPPTGVNGCTDPAFCEYDPLADCDDGSCMTSNADPGTCNTDCTAGDTEVWNSTTCACEVDVVSVLGCTDMAASNFDPNANCDDGTCLTNVFMVDGGNAGGPFTSDDPCACNNDESAPNAGDGTFSEVVLVTGPPGLNVIASGMSTGLIGVTLPAPFVETAPGNYELAFNHLNLVGFSVTVGYEDPNNPGSFIPALDANGNQLVQSNVCAYPVLTSSLPTVICNNAGMQDLNTLITEDNGDPPGTSTYTVDGAASGNMFDPSAYAVGQTVTIVATYVSTDDGNSGSSPDGTEPAHPGMCDQTFTASVTIQDCASCPTTSTADCPEDLCDGDTPTMFAVVVDDPLGTAVSSGWFADAAGTIPVGPVVNQGCASTTGATYFVVSCDSDADGVGDTDVVLLTHTFNVYPADFTANVSNTTDCTAPSVSITAADGTECGSSAGNAAATPTCPAVSSDENTYYEFTYFDGTSCEQFFSGLMTASCSGTCPCPAVIATAASEDVCGTSTPNLPADDLVIDDTTLGTVTWSPDPTIPVVSGCAPIVVVYTPTITCPNDCSLNTTGPTHTMTVYPDPADYDGAVAIDGTCGTSPTLDLSGVTCLPEITGPTAITATVDGCATDLDTANDPVDGTYEFTLSQPAATVAACATPYSATISAGDVACQDTCPGIVDFCELVTACVEVSECDGTSGTGVYTATITVVYNLSSGQSIDLSVDGGAAQSITVTNGALTTATIVVNGLAADNSTHTVDAITVDSNGICTASAAQVSFTAPEDCAACNVPNAGTVTGP